MLVSTSTSECRASFFPLQKNNFNGYSNICFEIHDVSSNFCVCNQIFILCIILSTKPCLFLQCE